MAAAVCNNRCKQQHHYADDKQMLMGDLSVVERKQMLSQQMSVFMTAKTHSSGRGNDVFTMESDQEEKGLLKLGCQLFRQQLGLPIVACLF